MSTTMPAIFVSHGAPSLIIDECPTRDFLKLLGQQLGRPRAIVSVSAHWTTAEPRVSISPRPETMYDFGGFAEELYSLAYQAPGDPVLGQKVLSLLKEQGIPGGKDSSRGLDHGTWVPLMLMYPETDIPVIQLSVQPHLDPGHHLAIGRALAPLREQGVLIMGSGAVTHNLADFFGRDLGAPPLPYASAFAEWVAESVTANRVEALTDYRRLGPAAPRNHPTPEHFLPLFVAMGAGRAGGRVLHDGFTYGAISMAAFAWD
ncbi:DODA-type extradiol aromatic ring-opening family dioxygenase [Geomonas agri]|uniref:DODA-type extradiol aromatic ring-opening family dioxygenase n=1 Tax=Geomonas agri TaxID=2873702 RepID=UPI001CD3C015|nr:class III extradiol ring-cleavage dioxygenase [Geomonas agri]